VEGVRRTCDRGLTCSPTDSRHTHADSVTIKCAGRPGSAMSTATKAVVVTVALAALLSVFVTLVVA
jgi:hypothetical protein